MMPPVLRTEREVHREEIMIFTWDKLILICWQDVAK